MFTTLAAAASLLLAAAPLTAALNPSCAPGGNFDLSIFELQLPTGSNGAVTTIPGSQLEGCNGYQSAYFFTNSADGSMGMKSPGSDCATTSGSEHCRTELHETSPSSWSPGAATNRLAAELVLLNGSSVCIGQVFQVGTGYSKPVAQLFYESPSGRVYAGVEQTPPGGDEKPYTIGTVAPGTKFSYEMRYENNDLCVALNGGACQKVPTPFTPPDAYFKVGDYNQGDDDADLHFFQVSITH